MRAGRVEPDEKTSRVVILWILTPGAVGAAPGITEDMEGQAVADQNSSQDADRCQARLHALESLYDRGAHLFVFYVERDPNDPTRKEYLLPKHWQAQRDSWETIAAAHAETPDVPVGCIVGSLGLSVPDIDVKDGKTGPGRQRLGIERAQAVQAWAGRTPCIVRTPSGGLHLFYRRRSPHGKRVLSGILDVALEVFGDTGFIQLYDPVRLLKHLDTLPMLSKDADMALGAPVGHSGGVSGGGRGHVEGDRNSGLYAKCVAALANDPDPEPAIAAAVKAAKEAGLPFAEIDATVASARKSDAAKRSFEALEAFLPEADDAWRPSIIEGQAPTLPFRQVAPYRGLEPQPSEHVEGQDDVADHLAVQWGGDLRYVWPRLPGARFDPSPFMRWTLDGWMAAPTLRGNVVRWTGRHLTALVWSSRKQKLVRRPLKKEGKSSEFATGCMKLLAMRSPVGTWAGEWDAEPHLLAIDATRAIDLLQGQVVVTAGRPLRRRRLACEPDIHWREGRLLAYLHRRLPDEVVRERQMLAWAAACFGMRLEKRSCFAVGPAGSWKTSYQVVLRKALGDGQAFPYGGKLPSAYLVSGTRTTEHKLDSALAELQGCRVAFFDETPTDRNGNAAPWSSAFVGDITSDMDGITFRRLGKDAGTAHGVTILGACNMLPALPKVDAVVGAIIARLLPIPWTVTGPDKDERMFLGSKEAMAQMLGLVMEYGPMAAGIEDEAPVPAACRQVLEDYVREPRA